MTQPEQSPQPRNGEKQSPALPKTIGVYDRPEPKKVPIAPIIAVVVIILLSLLAFWLVPLLF